MIEVLNENTRLKLITKTSERHLKTIMLLKTFYYVSLPLLNFFDRKAEDTGWQETDMIAVACHAILRTLWHNKLPIISILSRKMFIIIHVRIIQSVLFNKVTLSFVHCIQKAGRSKIVFLKTVN